MPLSTKKQKISLPSIFVLLFISTSSIADGWRELTPGIEYQDLSVNLVTPWSHIHVFRVDPQAYQFKLIFADALSRKTASAEEFFQHSNALITLNGGFFDRNFHPLGLRISQKIHQNPLKHISWWGIFYIKNSKAHITSVNAFKPSKHIDFAIQSGPRLIIDGIIPSLKPGIADRSALGITAEGQIIIVVTENNPISTTNLAHLMKSPTLGCQNALNLDGGSSSQLKANINSFDLNVHGLANVSDAIVVSKK